MHTHTPPKIQQKNIVIDIVQVDVRVLKGILPLASPHYVLMPFILTK